MAASLTVGDPVLCRVWIDTGAGGGQASVNAMHYIVASVGALAATDLDVATTLDALIQAPYKALLSALATYRGVQAQLLNPVAPYKASRVAQVANSNAGVGSVAGAIAPPQTCGLISYQTPSPGQAFRGRTYVAFPGQASDNGFGIPNATYTADLFTLGGLVTSGLGVSVSGRTAVLVRVILHRAPKVGPTPAPSPVTNYSVTARWATQRRRGDFGRQNRSPI